MCSIFDAMPAASVRFGLRTFHVIAPSADGSTMTVVNRIKRVLGRALLGLPHPSRSGRLTAPSSQRFGAWWARHPRLLHAFVAVSLCWSAAYLAWRIGFSAAGAEPVLWAALLLAELYGLWNLSTLAWMTWGVRLAPPAASAETDRQLADDCALSTDIYVCTYDEPLHVLEATLAGCALLREPHTTYLLDDGRREQVAELAGRWGAIWLTRPDNSHAKAGNINHALPLTNGDLVLILDADHVPMPDALRLLCKPFEDPEVALVQSPHDFSNHDSIQHYGLGRHEQSLFFSVICPGKERHGAAFWCGSGAIIRREALLQVGGVATETIAEDFHTTIKLHHAGWKSRYEPRTVVQGLAPHDLASYLLQRDRWARGNLAVFTTPESPLRAKRLTRAQRLSYLASLTGYLAGPVRLLLLSVLTAVLWSAALPLKIAPIALATLWAPATLLSILAGTALCRGVQSSAETCHFELCTAEIFTRALRCVVRPGRAQFRVTPKEGVDPGGWQSLRQFRVVLAIAIMLSLGIVLRVAQDLGYGFLPAMPGFAAWFVPLLGVLELRRVMRTLVIAGRRRQMRTEYRTPLEAAVFVERLEASQSEAHAEKLLLARGQDITLAGLGFEVETELQVESQVRLSLRLPGLQKDESTLISVQASVRSCRQTAAGWRVGAEITAASPQDRQRIVEYCHVIWPYRRLRTDAPSRPVEMPAALPAAAAARFTVAALPAAPALAAVE